MTYSQCPQDVEKKRTACATGCSWAEAAEMLMLINRMVTNRIKRR
jgi:hypothetical protein